MLREPGSDGPAMDIFDGFDIYIKDANGGLRIEYFDSEGQNHPDDVFTVDANNPTQLLAAEIYSRFDLNQDGIIGVDLINELASGAPTDPGNTWYQGRNRFAYSSDQGVVLTQERLNAHNPIPGETTEFTAGSYDLRNLLPQATITTVQLQSSCSTVQAISSMSKGLLCLLSSVRALIPALEKRSVMALSCMSTTLGSKQAQLQCQWNPNRFINTYKCL